MKTLLKLAVVGFAAALLASSPLAAADPMTESLRSLKGHEFEQKFLHHMIEHHREGIEMAKVVPHQTKRAELTRFAEKMIKSQQKDIDKMSHMLKDGAPGSHTTASHGDAKMDHTKMKGMKKDGMKMEGMKMAGMAQLESAQGPEFDRVFIQEMIKHHMMALEMSELAKVRAARSEVSKMAEKIIKEQKDEIKTLKGWQAKWSK